MPSYMPYLILISLALFNVGAMVVWAWHEDRVMRGEKPILATRWSLLEIYLGLQASLILSYIPLGAMFLIISASMPLNASISGQWFMRGTATMVMFVASATLLQQGAFIGVSDVFVRYRYKISWHELGFHLRVRAWEIGLGAVAGLGLYLIGIFGQQFLFKLIQWRWGTAAIDYISQNDPSVYLEQAISHLSISVVWAIAAVIITSVLAPLSEEMLFRGLIFNALRHRVGALLGVVISGFIFALAHFSLANGLIFWILGCVLAVLYMKSRSLWVVIIAHSVNNLISTLLLIYGRNFG